MIYETEPEKHIKSGFDGRFTRGSNSGSDTQQIPSLFRQLDDQLDVADCQGKLKLVFQPGFLQHYKIMLTSIQSSTPIIVGIAAARSVHRKLPVSRLMESSVVLHGQ